MINSTTEFTYSIKELKFIWSIRNDYLNPTFALIQWAKMRLAIDDSEIVALMHSILDEMEKIANENDCYEFEKVFEKYSNKWINHESEIEK